MLYQTWNATVAPCLFWLVVFAFLFALYRVVLSPLFCVLSPDDIRDTHHLYYSNYAHVKCNLCVLFMWHQVEHNKVTYSLVIRTPDCFLFTLELSTCKPFSVTRNIHKYDSYS